MKLADERSQLFKISNANLLQVGFAGSRRAITMRIGSVNAGDVAVQANRFGSCGNLPFGGAEEDADVGQVYFGDARRNGLGFQGLVDGAKDDRVVCHVDDHAAARQVSNDFVALREGATGKRE